MSRKRQQHPTDTPQIHYPDTRRAQLIFAAHWTLLALINSFVLLLLPHVNQLAEQLAQLRPYLGPLLLLSLALAVHYFYAAQTHYLSTSSQGLEYRKGTTRLRTSWENIARIERRRTRYGEFVVGLALHEPGNTAGLVALPTRGPVDFIPLNLFADWRRQPLGEQLRRYRPTLFEPENQAQGP